MIARRRNLLRGLGWVPNPVQTPIGVIDTWGVAWPQYQEPLACSVTDGACLVYNAALGQYNDALHRAYESERAFRNCQYDLERNNADAVSRGLAPAVDDCRVRFPVVSAPSLPQLPAGQVATVSPGGIYGGELAPILSVQPVQLPPQVSVTTVTPTTPAPAPAGGSPAAVLPVGVDPGAIAASLGLPPWALYAMGGLVLILLAGGGRR